MNRGQALTLSESVDQYNWRYMGAGAIKCYGSWATVVRRKPNAAPDRNSVPVGPFVVWSPQDLEKRIGPYDPVPHA